MLRIKLSSFELIEYLRVHSYECFYVSLVLNFDIFATHCISYRKSLIWDEGIDEKIIKWSTEEFVERYVKASWVVN